MRFWRTKNTIQRTRLVSNKRGPVQYEPDVGQYKADLLRRRSKVGLLKLILDGELRKMVEKAIRKRVSPQRISKGLKTEGTIVSAKAIYKFVIEYSLESFL